LGFALPVTGELSGTWGDTVNDYITKYVDSAVAGTQTISGSQTAVTLTVTNGTTLTQVGSGSSGSAQYAVINCTGNPAGLLTITAPASSRQYLIINATSTSQSVKIVGTGPTTGVTMVSGESAIVAWNGSDYVKVASSAADGVTTFSAGTTGFTPSTATSGAVTLSGTLATTNGGTGLTSFTANRVFYASSTSAIGSSANLTFDGTTLTAANFADSSLTSGRVTYAGASGNLTDSANLTFDGTTLTANDIIDSSLTASKPVFTNASKNLVSTGTVPTDQGGTGLTSFTSGGVVFASSTSALSTGSGLTFSGNNFSNTVGNIRAIGASNALVGAYSANSSSSQLALGNAAGTNHWVIYETIDSGGNIADLQIYNNTAASTRLTVTTAGFVRPVAYADTVSALGNTGTASTINLQNANVFTATLTGNCTFTLSNAIATGSSSFTLVLTNDGTAGRTVAWAGGSFVFPGGAATLSRTTTANATDVWVFFTTNGGSTWYGNIAMKDVKA
jgi:hypothetical protein